MCFFVQRVDLVSTYQVQLHGTCFKCIYRYFSVQASNPGQFDSDMEATQWSKGVVPDSVYHHGNVGINTERPEEALTVHGNIKLTGQIYQTSDIRAKQDLVEVILKDFYVWESIGRMLIFMFG